MDLYGDGSSTASPTSSTGDETMSAGGTDGQKLDIGGYETMADDGPGDDEGCKAVDLLFIVDRSPSMEEEQINLIASGPKWIDAIVEQLPEAADFRVMVVDMDDEFGTSYCDGCSSGCSYQNGSFFFDVPDYPCDYQPSACDAQLGAGRVINAGYLASNEMCGFPEGRRWLQFDDPDVEEAFTCAARVGLSGTGDEQSTRALANAVSAAQTGPGGCNEGFIRDEALLVAVLVTDEDEDDFEGDLDYVDEFAPQVYADLIALKGGDENGVVMIGLLDDHMWGEDYECEEPAFPLNFNPAPNLRAFIDQFPRHFYGSVCAPDYSVPLIEAIATIDDACDEYIPPVD